MKPDNVTINILNRLYPDTMFIGTNGNGVHPKTVFGLVGEISNRTIGTMRKELRSSTGEWFHAQPKEYTLSIALQGDRSSTAYDIAEDIQFFLNTTKYKAEFYREGFSIRVDHSPILSLPVQLDTSVFMRYQFNIFLTTDIYTLIEQDSIDEVEITGKFKDSSYNVIHEYSENILEDDVVFLRGWGYNFGKDYGAGS